MRSLNWNSVGGEIGAGEVSMSGESVARLAVDKKTDLGDARQIGVQSCADGHDREGFSLETGGMAGDEGSGEVDDGELGTVG